VVSALIRPAVTGDLAALQLIERAAGDRYRHFGMADVADDEPPSIEVLEDYATDGRAWVAVDDTNSPIAYILADLIDGAAHVEQVSVSPEFQGHGIGRAMIEQVRAWAVGRGITAMTLTTFADIPWNRPLYEHLGFRVLTEGEIGPGLRRVCEEEARHGLKPELRVAMRRDLASESGS
jgi:GNAT superfamily N-acetyltransferase